MDRTLHIVIIEDEKKSLNLLETLLEQVKGIQIDGSFTDPEEGLKTLTEHQPDLIILDALRKKAVDYLLKPVSLETLRNCIKKFRSDYFRKDGVESEIKANDLVLFNRQHKHFVSYNIIDCTNLKAGQTGTRVLITLKF